MFQRHAVLTVLSVTVLTSLVNAQGAVPTPPSSSLNWLNLNRQGGSLAQNYYGIVRPNNMFQNGLVNVQQEYNNLSQTMNNSDPNAMRGTGHAATFMNYGHYYPKMGAGSAQGRAGGPTSRR